MLNQIFKNTLLSFALCAGVAANTPMKIAVQNQDETIIFTSTRDLNFDKCLLVYAQDQGVHTLSIFPGLNDPSELEEAFLKKLSAREILCTEYPSDGPGITYSKVEVRQIIDMQKESLMLENGISGSRLTVKCVDEDEDVSEYRVSILCGTQNGYALYTEYELGIGDREKIFKEHDELINEASILNANSL